MKERPILFSAPMVRAILEGRKTQTRRVMKPQPVVKDGWFNWDGHAPNSKYGAYAANHIDLRSISIFVGASCPYGRFGDRLWVRETWGVADTWLHDCETDPPRVIAYRADNSARCFDPPHDFETDHWSFDKMRWRPSIHMPRWASRITLEVTSVRVERLQDISEADAAAEGVESLDSEAHCEREDFDHALCSNCGGRRLYDAIGPNMGVCPDTDCRDCDTHVKRYRWLWESINGAESWAANQWVWVVEFKRVTE